LKPELILGVEASYNVTTPWMQASLNAYYNQMTDVTEYSMAYNDIEHSFTYISLTGIKKQYYGVELGLNFKVNDVFNIKALGTISEAKYANDSDVRYVKSDGQKAADGSIYFKDVCLNKDMREGGTPLAAVSLDLNYHNHGWFIDLIGNYYDKIYLYYSPITRYKGDLEKAFDKDNDGVLSPEESANMDANIDLSQSKGKGGFMLDASIGKSFFLKKGRSLAVNVTISNILNNTKICTGGMEQNRKDIDESGETIRTYNFKNNPKKFYAFGINGMVNVTYKF
jgi:outer membrane receptor protein involved in Fe transport